MSEEELNEAIEYNLEYMEAMQSEEIFGGDYTSSVELKYANKIIDRLQQENKQLKAKVDLLTGKKIAEIDKEAKQIKIKAIKQQNYKHIIDELEQYLEKEINDWNDVEDTLTRGMVQEDKNILNKIKELKGSDINE